MDFAGIQILSNLLKIEFRVRINEELAKSNFKFFFRIEFNLHLIINSQKMNHQEGILRIITKIKFNKEVRK